MFGCNDILHIGLWSKSTGRDRFLKSDTNSKSWILRLVLTFNARSGKQLHSSLQRVILCQRNPMDFFSGGYLILNTQSNLILL